MKPTKTEKLEYSSDIRKILHPTIPKAYLISIAATMLISASWWSARNEDPRCEISSKYSTQIWDILQIRSCQTGRLLQQIDMKDILLNYPI